MKQHRSEAESYLRTGYIPAVALPAEAASAYGKAQSAARVGRYADALALLEKAQSIMRDSGIQRWQEGQEFSQKLQESIDAENMYEEGLATFQQGQIEAAIEKVESASRATGLPKYADKARDFRQVKDTLRSINEALNQAAIDPEAVTQAKASLDRLIIEYGANPAFDKLIERFKSVVPRVVEPLKEQTRSLYNQANRAPTLEEAMYFSKQAKQSLDQIRNLEGVDEDLNRLQNEIEKLQREITKFDNDLQSAMRSYENRPGWPSEAARLSAGVSAALSQRSWGKPAQPQFAQLPLEADRHPPRHRIRCHSPDSADRQLGCRQIQCVYALADSDCHPDGDGYHDPHAYNYLNSDARPDCNPNRDTDRDAQAVLQPGAARYLGAQRLLHGIFCRGEHPCRRNGALPAFGAALR